MDERNKLIEQLIKEEGGTRPQYLHLMKEVTRHETGGTFDSTLQQAGRRGKGPGVGNYQFERGKNAGAITAARRTKSYYNDNNIPIKKWLEKASAGNDLDVSTLTPEQQDILFLGNMKVHPKADLSKIWKGEQSIPEFWANYHWAGPRKHRKERIEGFKDTYVPLDMTKTQPFIQPTEVFKRQFSTEEDIPIKKFAYGGITDPIIKAKDNTNVNIPLRPVMHLNPRKNDFIEKWHNSPKYNELLKNNSSDKEYNNIKGGRLDNIQNTIINYNRQDKEEQLNNGIRGDATGTKINVYNTSTPQIIADVETHERSHASDAPIENIKYKIDNFLYENYLTNKDPQLIERLIPKSDINLINKYQPTSKYDTPGAMRLKKARKINGDTVTEEDYDWIHDKERLDYLSEPTEVRARLNNTRERALKEKIYNPFKEKLTKEQYDKLNNIKWKTKMESLLDLQELYDDNEIIDLLNKVSSNTNKSNKINIAAYGGSIGQALYGGSFSSYGVGGRHETNPNGGVMLGPKASVEQGETSFNFRDMGKYIFSNRITSSGVFKK